MNEETIRFHKLREIAMNDDIYQVWQCSYLDAKEAFAAFAATQPEDIRNTLYAYADSGRMALQRQVNLACRHMRFPGEEE